MSATDDIKNAIRTLAKTDDAYYSYSCKVISVDGNKCDCEPLNGDADLLEVRLIADDKTGNIVIPKVDSTVLVTMINKMTGYVSMFSAIESVELNGNEYEGLVRVIELTAKLNNLENDINVLKTAFSTWIIAPSDGGAALKAATATWYGSLLTPTLKTELKNDTVKHGKG